MGAFFFFFVVSGSCLGFFTLGLHQNVNTSIVIYTSEYLKRTLKFQREIFFPLLLSPPPSPILGKNFILFCCFIFFFFTKSQNFGHICVQFQHLNILFSLLMLVLTVLFCLSICTQNHAIYLKLCVCFSLLLNCIQHITQYEWGFVEQQYGSGKQHLLFQ